MSDISSQVWIEQIKSLLIDVQRELGFPDQVLEKNSDEIIHQIFALSLVYAVLKKAPEQRDAILSTVEQDNLDLNHIAQQIGDGLEPQQSQEAFQEACLDVFIAFFGKKYAKTNPDVQNTIKNLVETKLKDLSSFSQE